MKKVILILFCILLSTVLFGCSNSSKQTAEKGKLLEQIKQRGKVIIATEAAFAPFEFMENGKIVGYGADILAEVVKNLGVPMEQLDVPFSGILPGLQEKKFDFVATSIVASPERKEKFGLTNPIADATLALMKRADDTSLQTIEDLDGKIIGCMPASPAEKQMQEFDKKLKAEGKKGITIKTFPSSPEAYIDLKNKRIDAVTQSLSMVNVLVKKHPNDYGLVGTYGDRRYISWAVRKEDKDLLDFLNAEILKLKKSGKLAELQKKWFGTTWDLPDTI